MKKEFSQIYDSWIGEKKLQVRTTTLAAYSYLAEHYLLPVFGNSRNITSLRLQHYINYCHESGLSRHTLNNLLSVLHMVLRYGATCGWCEQPDISLRLPPHKNSRQPNVLTVREEKLLLKHLQNHPSPLNMAVLMSMTTGLRLGEICGLQVGDLQLCQHFCQVNRTVAITYERVTHQTHLSVNLPKTANSSRTVPLHPHVAQLLEKLKKRQDTTPETYLFTGEATPLHPNQLRKHYRQTLSQLGLPPLRFHCLRHTFATRCIESGCDVKTLSAILGHANVQTTLNLYVHPSMEQKQRCLLNMMQLVMDSKPALRTPHTKE